MFERAQARRESKFDVNPPENATPEGLVGYATAPNPSERGRLIARLGELLATTRRQHAVVLLIQFDQVDLVAGTFGHAAADGLLVAVAARLRSTLGDDDWLAPLDRDRLVVVCEASRGLDVTQGLVERIRGEVLVEPFEAGNKIGDDGVTVTAAIGIATAETSGVDPERLLADADLALGAAQDGDGNRVAWFTPTERDEVLARLTLPAAIHRGLDRGEFAVHYQPVVNLENDACTGAEALLRWAHPEQGLLAPEEFIDAAESTGVIATLGAWVLQEACRGAASWPRSAVRDPLSVAVNLSACQLEVPDFANLVADTLSDTGLEPGRLTVEVTERIMVRHPEMAVRRLDEVRSLGVRVAIDDFGTGYSCLTSLKDLPLDIIKIDRYFVTGLCADPVDRAIVAAIVALARALHLDVIAEGVETVDQATELRRLGCSHIQGYLCGRPEPDAPHSTRWNSGGGDGGLHQREAALPPAPLPVWHAPRRDPTHMRAPWSSQAKAIWSLWSFQRTPV